MQRFGLVVLALLSPILAATATVQAQNTTSSERMVRAFQDYCINTDPERARAELTARLGRPLGTTTSMQTANVVHTVVEDTWTGQGDPHSRLYFVISKIDGAPCSCSVIAAWAERTEIIRTLAANIVLAEATTRVEHGSEITRWTTQARDAQVVVELRIPTYVNEPGRSLTLYMKAEPMHGCKLPDLEAHLPSDSR